MRDLETEMSNGSRGIVILTKGVASFSHHKPVSGLSQPALAVFSSDCVEGIANEIDKTIMVLQVGAGNNRLDLGKSLLGDVEPGRVRGQELDIVAVFGHKMVEAWVVVESGIVKHKGCVAPVKHGKDDFVKEVDELGGIPGPNDGMVGLDASMVKCNH